MPPYIFYNYDKVKELLMVSFYGNSKRKCRFCKSKKVLVGFSVCLNCSNKITEWWDARVAEKLKKK